jgi:hypothetical protein
MAMPSHLQSLSISLAPGHRDVLKKAQEKIRNAINDDVGKSMAVQIALLAFSVKKEALPKLVARNRSMDKRRTGS